MTKQTHTPDNIAARHANVARMLLARTTQQEMAARLKVSQATISGDIAAIRAAWKDEARADLRELIAQECRVLDADEAAWRKRMQDALPGDLPLAVRIYDRIIAPIGERRARLRGMLPAPPEGNTAKDLLDQVLDSLGLGPEDDPLTPYTLPPAEPTDPTPLYQSRTNYQNPA